MDGFEVCGGTPQELVKAVLCLDELSKDVRGDLTLLLSEVEVCRRLDCRTLTTEHVLRAELGSHDCDSEVGRLFDGRLVCKDLTTVFVDGNGERRGTHVGTFAWRTAAGLVTGELRGMTNEGTHREPAFDGCQRCDERGVMEGRLCGTVVRPAEPALAGAQVVAAYRFRFDPSEQGGEGAVSGTLEGLVVRSCATTRECVEFTAVGTDSNPRVVGDLTVETRDLNGATPDTAVVSWGNHTGLHLWHSATLGFAQPVSQVEVTLVHFVQHATATAFDASGSAVAAATMSAPQDVAETLVLAGSGITSVVIDSPQDEVLMPRVCWRL